MRECLFSWPLCHVGHCLGLSLALLLVPDSLLLVSNTLVQDEKSSMYVNSVLLPPFLKSQVYYVKTFVTLATFFHYVGVTENAVSRKGVTRGRCLLLSLFVTPFLNSHQGYRYIFKRLVFFPVVLFI